jgi:predicted nucleic acid-binding protein
MARVRYLADSNILLRLLQRPHPEHELVSRAVLKLRADDIELAYTLQNMAEFWNASTRPYERNGFGQSIEETERRAHEIELSFSFLPDGLDVYREWRRLVVEQRVSGVEVHDARLVAAMYVHDIAHILTLSTKDFQRYGGIVSVHPREILIP